MSRQRFSYAAIIHLRLQMAPCLPLRRLPLRPLPRRLRFSRPPWSLRILQIPRLLHLPVLDESGAELGKLQEVISTGANDVFYVKGAHEYMIPAVPEFVLERNIDEGFIRVRLIEGMQTDAL